MKTYEDRKAKQLADWVEGNAVHNDVDGECCPDFACCSDKVATPREARELFARAVAEEDSKTIMTMLGGFLGAGFADVIGKAEVYIAGEEPGEMH